MEYRSGEARRKKSYEDICKSASLGTLRKPFIGCLLDQNTVLGLEGLSTRLYLRFQVSRFVFR